MEVRLLLLAVVLDVLVGVETILYGFGPALFSLLSPSQPEPQAMATAALAKAHDFDPRRFA